MATLLFLAYLIFTLVVVYQALHARVWEIGSLVYLAVATFYFGMPWIVALILWPLIIAAIFVIEVEAIRFMISEQLYKSAGNSIPKLSKTEEQALNAGDTWLEQDIFIGKPDWERLAAVKTELTEEEQAFLDNETQTLCSMLDEWEITQTQDLPPKVWTYIKENGFFGLVIPKEFGGKGFSARTVPFIKGWLPGKWRLPISKFSVSRGIKMQVIPSSPSP